MPFHRPWHLPLPQFLKDKRYAGHGNPAYRSAGAVRLPADGPSKRHLFPGNPASLLHHRRVQTGKCGSYGAQRAGPPDRHQSHDVRPRQTISDHGGTASGPSESPVPFCLFFPTYSNCSSPFSKTQPFPPALFPSLSFHGQAPDWRPAGDSPGKFPFRRRFSRRKTAIPSRNLSSKSPYAPCSTNRKGFSRFPISKK